MLVSDAAIAKRAEPLLEIITFFILPLVLLSLNIIPFALRYLPLVVVTILCFGIYLTRGSSPTISTSWQALTAWAAVLLTTVATIWLISPQRPTFELITATYSLGVSIVQEFLFREYLQKRLFEAFNNAIASILLTSVVFAVIHVLYTNPGTMLITTFAFSVVISAVYHVFDDLVAASIVHTVANYLAITSCFIAIPGTC